MRQSLIKMWIGRLLGRTIRSMELFFTKAGFVVAWLLFVPSIIAYVAFQVAAFGGSVSNWDPLFLGLAKSSPMGILVGVGFGIAAEISDTLANKA
ncbi:hypothetical protein [Tabrizicola flagellatus]|uniref:hypothetical protein n=1 Tax=Tabrizicola flagellatus TaxID=2593021 RepID=UPI0011F0E369|nr:hypothetical protein [Tabrizicola flagellatus]